MKKLIFSSILVLVIELSFTGLYSQSNSSENTDSEGSKLFTSTDKISFSGYGAPVVKISQFNKQWETLAGGSGGMLINDTLCIGLAGYALAGTFNKTYAGVENKIGMGYGGLLFQYYVLPKSLITLEFGTLIGAGGAGYSSQTHDEMHHNGRGKVFFIVEPEAGIFLNLTKFARLGLGTSYRYIRGANTDGMSDKDLRNFSYTMTAAFGWF